MEMITLSKLSQTQKDKYFTFSLICGSLYKYKQTMCAQMTSKWKQNNPRTSRRDKREKNQQVKDTI